MPKPSFAYAKEPVVIRIPPEEMEWQDVWKSPRNAALEANPHQRLLQLEKVREYADGTGVVVGIADTGVERRHPDLEGVIVDARDFTSSRSGDDDVAGHGTHVAGIVASQGRHGAPVGAAPGAKIVMAKVLGDQGSGLDSWIAAGISWLVDQKVDVISLSLGSGQPSQPIHEAIRRAESAGILVCAAAGNSGPGDQTVGYPGGFDESICTAAMDDDGRVARFSSRGPQVDATAVGVNVLSTLPGGRSGRMSGTSMSTPQMAGVCALVVSAMKKAAKAGRVNPAAFRRDLYGRFCNDIDPRGLDNASGYGYPVVVDWARELVGVQPPPPPPGDTVAVTIEEVKAVYERCRQLLGL